MTYEYYIGIGEALQSLRPKAEWVLRGDEIEWHDKIQTQPTDAEIQEEITRLKAEYDSQEYARKRKDEYDQMGNQFEMMFDDKRDGTTTWVDKINEIKGKYPK